jgi:uncharacterized protein YqeY
MKESMKVGDKERLSTIRLILANLKQKDIDARPSGNLEGISESQILQLLQTMIKQRKDSIDMFAKGNRFDLIEKEKAEIIVIESFLPQQMDDAAITIAIQEAIQAMGATSPQDMGKVMTYLKDHHTGQMDFSKASLLVKQKLV